MFGRLLGEEMAEFLGAAPHQRTEQRRRYRDGHRPRTLTTRMGRLELQVPRDRQGRFCTEPFERYQRSEKTFVPALMQVYVQGVSTRKVKKVTRQLCGVDSSRSQISELASGLGQQGNGRCEPDGHRTPSRLAALRVWYAPRAGTVWIMGP